MYTINATFRNLQLLGCVATMLQDSLCVGAIGDVKSRGLAWLFPIKEGKLRRTCMTTVMVVPASCPWQANASFSSQKVSTRARCSSSRHLV